MNQHTNVNTGGGSIVGSNVASDSATVTAQMIQNMKGNISQSGNMDQNGAELFQAAFDAIKSLNASDDERQAVAKQLDQLREEVQKANAKPGILKMCWTAVWSVAKELPAIAKLGAWLAAKYAGVIIP